MAASILPISPVLRGSLAGEPSLFAPSPRVCALPNGSRGPRAVAGHRRVRRGLQATTVQASAARSAAPSAMGMSLPWLLAAAMVLLAAVAAPEQPQAQEAICQRQAGVEACRVW